MSRRAEIRASFLASAAIAIAFASAGCRLTGYAGQASKSVVSCRQLSQRGASAIDRQDWAAAEAFLSRAVETCPVDAYARRLYGETLWQRGAHREAIAQWEEAVRLSSEDAAVRVRLANARLTLGDVEGARHDIDEAISLDPRSAEAWATRARVKRQLRDPTQALADYHRALRYDATHVDSLIGLAELYLETQQPQRALANIQSCLDAAGPDEEPPQLLALAGVAYHALGRYDEAVVSYQAAATLGPPTADLMCRLAEAELANGQPENARLALAQALELDPRHPQGQALKAQLAQLPSVVGSQRR